MNSGYSNKIDTARTEARGSTGGCEAARAKARGSVGDGRIGVMLLTSSLERGGAERQVVALANNLDPTVFRVHVCSLSRDNPLAEDLHDAAHRLLVVPKRHKYDVGLIWRVAKLLKKLDISVIHSFMFDAEIVGRLAGRWAGTAAVICSNRCPHLHRKSFKLWVAKLTAGCFDMMVANSWAGMEFERDCQGVSPSRLCVIPNGVDTDRFQPGDGREQRRALGISPRALVVGMFAHFRGNKNHRMFIEGAAKALRADPEAMFVCVGQPDGDEPGTCFRAARDAVAAACVEDNVLFLGERSDVTDLYKMCDVKVLCSNFEGTPNVVLEAMASGLPVIATDVSDNARIILDGETGFIVPSFDTEALADRLTLLLSDDELRLRLGEAARLRAIEEFSLRTLAQRSGEAYLGVLERKGGLPAGNIVAVPGR